MAFDPALLSGPLADEVAALTLVDHHVHGALRAAVDRPTFESMITEAPVAPRECSQFDSQLGFAIRRWCAPLLGLPAHAAADDYWAARTELGNDEANRRLLTATGTGTFLLETGYLGDTVLDPAGHAAASGATVREVVRLETVAEQYLAECGSAAEFVDGYPARLAVATEQAVAVKSILAYRHGFDIPADRPDRTAVPSSRRDVAPPFDQRPEPAIASAMPWSCDSCCGAGWTEGCRSSCTPGTAIPTWICTARIRCCSPVGCAGLPRPESG